MAAEESGFRSFISAPLTWVGGRFSGDASAVRTVEVQPEVQPEVASASAASEEVGVQSVQSNGTSGYPPIVPDASTISVGTDVEDERQTCVACDERPHTVINRPCGCCFYCELCTVKAVGLVTPGRLRCGRNAWVEVVDWREPGPPTVQRLRTHGNTATPEGSYTLAAFMGRYVLP